MWCNSYRQISLRIIQWMNNGRAVSSHWHNSAVRIHFNSTWLTTVLNGEFNSKRDRLLFVDSGKESELERICGPKFNNLLWLKMRFHAADSNVHIFNIILICLVTDSSLFDSINHFDQLRFISVFFLLPQIGNMIGNTVWHVGRTERISE